jgi:type IV secretory pathway TrbF-like protein
MDRQQEWRRDYGSKVDAARRRFELWRLIAAGVWASALIVGGLTVWQATVVNIRPFVSVSDPQGRVALGVQPSELDDITTLVQWRFAQDFIFALREIPSDDVLVLAQLMRLKAFTPPNSQARTKANDSENIDNPQSRIVLSDERMREIKIDRVELQEPGAWLVVWTEIERSKASGQYISSFRYQGILRVVINPPVTAQDLVHNPAALGVKDFDVVRLRDAD